jgi:hypothetical protein
MTSVIAQFQFRGSHLRPILDADLDQRHDPDVAVRCASANGAPSALAWVADHNHVISDVHLSRRAWMLCNCRMRARPSYLIGIDP